MGATAVLASSGEIIPAPPDFVAGDTIVWGFTILFSAIAAGTLVWAVVKRLRGGSAIPLFLWLGGLAASLQEPIQDHLVHVWWAQDAPGPVFRMFDIGVPFWVPPIYAFCLCLTAYRMWRIFQRGVTMRQVWLIWAAFSVVDVVLEIPAVNTGAWEYYGQQPFEFFNFPLYNFWTNGVGFMAIAVVLYVLFPAGEGGPREWRAAFAPLIYVASWMVVPVPVVISLNAALPGPIAWAISLLSLGIALAAVWVMAAIVGVDGPATRLGNLRLPHAEREMSRVGG